MSKNCKPGATLPDFELPDENGDAAPALGAPGRRRDGAACSAAASTARASASTSARCSSFHEWCSVAFTQLVTVLPERPARRLQAEDLDRRALDVPRRRATSRCRRTLEIDEYTDPHHDATVPHTLVLAPGLVIDKVYVGYWFWGRPSPYQLWEDLGTCSARIKPDFDPTTPRPAPRGRRHSASPCPRNARTQLGH